MKRLTRVLGQAGLVFCVATTVALAIFVATLALAGQLKAEKLDAALRGFRGEEPAVARPAAAPAARKPMAGDAGEIETLVAIAESWDRELRTQEKARRELLAAEKTAAEAKLEAAPVAASKPAAGEGPAAAAVETPAGTGFQANLNILRNLAPKNAASMMAGWPTADAVTYLKAMKSYEAADILTAMLAMGKKGGTDFEKKAKEVQAALGK